MSKTEVKKIIREFAEVLRKNRIAFKKIYLFGSYAAGRATKDSDIDVAVVLARLPRGMGRLKKKMELWKLAPKADSRIEPILLGEKDLIEGEASIMGNEVRKHGILVAEF